MERHIEAFQQDADRDWVAELSCGHRRHMRHKPPLVERAWVTTAEGRAAHIGTPLDCALCARSQMPEGFVAYKRTPVFDADTVPAGLLETHATKLGVWGLLHVLEGRLEYVQHTPFDTREWVTPAAPAVIVSAQPHHVHCPEAVRFQVEFWRRDAPATPGTARPGSTGAPAGGPPRRS